MDFTRIEKLGRYIKEASLDGVLVCPSEDLRFLTGFSPMMCERFQGLFVTAGGDAFYVCNLLYAGEIHHEFGGEIPLFTWMDGESMTDVVKAALEKYGLLNKTLGVNLTVQAFNALDIARDCSVNFVNGVDVVEEARICKTPQEVDCLRRAATMADAAFSQVVDYIKPGMSEGDIFRFLCEKMTEAGGENPWAIVASGPNSSYPHYMGQERIIGEQDIIILDFGCSCNGLYSDMSRTLFVGGATDHQKKVYQLILEANKAGERKAVVGAFIPDVDKASRDIIDGAGYRDNFINRVGHGIGYMMHEGPYIHKNNRRNLEPGMAFSIEPGIYIAGDFGIRIEDIVVVTENGNEILNKAPKEMIMVK